MRTRRETRLLCALLVWAVAGCTPSDEVPDDLVPGLPDELYWPDNSDYPGVGGGRILVTNNGDDTVSVLDIQTFELLASVPVGLIPAEREGPHHVATDPSGEFYYVGISNYVPGSGSGPHGAHGTGTADGHALKIRASDNAILTSTRVDRSPGDVRLTPDSEWLLMTHFDLLRVQETIGDPFEDSFAGLAVIDAGSFEILSLTMICPAPHGMLPSADGTQVYASCYGSDQLAVIDLDPATGIPLDVRRVDVAADAGRAPFTNYDPYALTVSPADGSVWVSCWKSDSVLVFDPSTGAMDPSRSIFFYESALPGFGEFTSDGSELFVPRLGPDVIARIDPNTTPPTIMEQVVLPDPCFNVHLLKILPGETHAAIVCEGNHIDPGWVLRWEIGTTNFDRTVVVGVFPDDAQVLMTDGNQ